MGNFRIALVKAELGSGSWEGPGSGPLALSPLAPGPLHNRRSVATPANHHPWPQNRCSDCEGFFPPLFLFIYLFICESELCKPEIVIYNVLIVLVYA